MASTDTIVILNGPEDWETWFKYVTNSVTHEQWTEILSPDNNAAVAIPPPITPLPPHEYSAAYRADKQAWELSRAPRGTRSNSTNSTITYQPVEPVTTDPKYLLTTEERGSYQVIFAAYTQARSHYKEYQANYNKCQELLMKHLGKHPMAVLDGGETPREIMQKLQKRYKPSDERSQERARQRYKEAVKKPNKTGVTDLKQWLNQWETAMLEGRRHNVPDCASRATWKRDLMDAIGNTLQSLSGILQVDPDLVPRIDRTLPADYLDISAAVEDDWSQQGRHDINAKPPKRGAFLAVHTGNTASEDDSTASGVQQHQSRASGRNRTIQGRRAQSERPVCDACGGRGHGFKECFFIDTVGRYVKIPNWQIQHDSIMWQTFMTNKNKPKIKRYIQYMRAEDDSLQAKQYWGEVYGEQQ
jgi:hypothetical protein